MVKKDIVSKWTTVRIRDELYNEIEKGLHKDIIKKQGISSISQFVTNAIAKQLEEMNRTGFKHVMLKDDTIEIFDENIGENGKLASIQQNKNKLICLECNSKDCPHTNYIWSIEHIANDLEEKGIDRKEKTCPKCGVIAKQEKIDEIFGYRKNNNRIITQSYCKECRNKRKK